MIRTAQTFESWHKPVPLSIRSYASLGGLVIAGTLGIGLLWAALAPIDGAAIAPGQVIATGQNKTIQHLEGGIIENILVKEGDNVEAGTALIRLSETAALANLTRVSGQLDTLRIIEARYLAERDGLREFNLPEDLKARRTEPPIASLVDGQMREFTARRQSLDSQLAVMQKQIDATLEQISGLEAQRTATNSQMALIEEELKDTRSLFKQGFAQKTRVLALERTSAELGGARGAFTAQIEQARQSIAEIEGRILATREAWMEKAMAELRDVQIQVADFHERFKAAKDVATRLDIRTPVAGTVVKLHFTTEGGVIPPGQVVADILPVTALEIEARINPQDINRVQPGRIANVRFPALRSRLTPTIPATVEFVSADRLSDPRTGEGYYTARLKITDKLDELEKAAADKLVPGMPAEVHVETGERTFLQYLFAPIDDIIVHAFREP
jgi:HlyD family type I secretion membrane fusion protein